MAVSTVQLLFLVLFATGQALGARNLEQSSAAASMKEQVLAYWSAALGGSSPPQELESWVSPLSISETQLFERKIDAGKLVNDNSEAQTFCSSSHLICGSNVATFDFSFSKANKNQYSVNPTKAAKGQYSVNPTAGSGKNQYSVDPAATMAISAEDLKAQQYLWFFESDLLQSDSSFTVPSTIADFHGAPKRPAFLPRDLVEALGVPTVSNVPKLMSELHIPESSLLATVVEQSSAVCDTAGKEVIEGEFATCITSLEQLADILAAKFPSFKKDGVKLMRMGSVDSSASSTSFKVVKVELEADTASPYLVGHPSEFPYSLFFGHYLPETKVYSVYLESKEEYRHIAAALCHMNTAEWNPNHVAFQLLGTKPGAGEICHWVSADGFLVVPSTH